VRDDGATDETLAATGPVLAKGTTRGSDPTVSAELVREVTRASSVSQTSEPAVHDTLPVVDRSNYQIVSELARGGMGRILEAHDLRLDRPIAIKEVLHGDEGARARFDREVRITAGLQHPAIVHVTEAGQWPDGQPFFAMKLIRGKPLDVQIAEAKSLTGRLTLLPAVIAVTDALAYAHTRSVIHRDLKPANVLVGDFGETVVIDWGIAKDLSDAEEIVSLTPEVRGSMQLKAGAAETVVGSVMGTPSYMPPEQANGERVDARADVYALGAMLYQVLAGVPPFIGRTTAEVLAKVLEGAPEPLASIVPDAPIDLITIVEKAMARTPAERFPTANEMVAELKSFQRGMLVKSHDYTTWQLIKRWFRRNRGAVVVGAIAFTALCVVGGVLLWRNVEAQREAEVEATAARAQADHGLIGDARSVLATDPTEALAILKQLSPGSRELRAARMIASEAAGAGVAHVLTADGSVRCLAFSPDGRSLASYQEEGRKIRLWDLATWSGRELGSSPGKLLDLVLTADTLRGIDDDGRIWAWSMSAPSAPQLVRSLDDKVEFVSAQWSPDGTRVVADVLETNGHISVRVFDLKSDDRLLGEYRSPVWTTDGRAILAHDRNHSKVIRFEVATGQLTELFDGPFHPVLAGDATHTWIGRDSRSYAPGDQNFVRELGSGRRVDLGTEVVMLVAMPGGRVVGTTSKTLATSTSETMRTQKKGQLVMFDPIELSRGDHAVLVSDGWDGSTLRLTGHNAAVEALAVSRTGTIASGDRKGMIRVWTLPVVARDHGDGKTSSTFALLERGNELVITRRGPRLEVRDLARGATRLLEITEVAPGITRDLDFHIDRNTRIGNRMIRESSQGPDAEVVELVRAADGRRVVTLDTNAHAVVWDLVGGTGRLLADKVVHVAINHDGSKIATSRLDGDNASRLIEEWDVTTGTPTKLGAMVALTMLYGPGDRLAIATDQNVVMIYDHRIATPLEFPARHAYRALAFSPDGKRLFLGSDTWEIVVHHLETKHQETLHGHMGTVLGLAVSSDGKRLFSSSIDNTVRVWNLADGSSIPLRGHTGLVSSFVLGDPDTLFTSSYDGTARVWDLTTHASRPLVGQEDRVLLAQPIDGGQRILVVDRAHQVAEYADTLPYDETLLRSWLASVSNLTK